MENRQLENLSEILGLIDNVQREISMIKSKLSELGASEPADVKDIDGKEDLDLIDIVDVPEAVTADEAIKEAPKNILDEKEPATTTAGPHPGLVSETVSVPTPEPVSEAVPVREMKKTAVVDAMLDREAWRTDRPSSPVKDIRSAISLNDRILFINTLFKGDPEAFQNTIGALNAMESFDDAVSYITGNYPEWKMESDSVYRFMMAVRRRIDK